VEFDAKLTLQKAQKMFRPEKFFCLQLNGKGMETA